VTDTVAARTFAIFNHVQVLDEKLPMPTKARSPIKDKPLRLPGQSIAEEREDLLDSSVEQPLIFALFIVVLAAFEWWRDFTDMKPSPVIFTLAALLTVLYAAIRIWRVMPKLRALRQGLEGERAVGQFLERLREQGYQVFHDVVGSGFNVDHVLVGPAGVFTVETKTWSKPTSGNAQVTFDGTSIRAGIHEPDRDPVVQAKAQASWLKSVLLESTGRKFDVKPVIVFPGWYVLNSSGTFKEVWVLEPKALPSFLGNEPSRLSVEEAKLASFHLSRMIRTSQGERR
jgi:hypothetical protein